MSPRWILWYLLKNLSASSEQWLYLFKSFPQFFLKTTRLWRSKPCSSLRFCFISMTSHVWKSQNLSILVQWNIPTSLLQNKKYFSLQQLAFHCSCSWNSHNDLTQNIFLKRQLYYIIYLIFNLLEACLLAAKNILLELFLHSTTKEPSFQSTILYQISIHIYIYIYIFFSSFRKVSEAKFTEESEQHNCDKKSLLNQNKFDNGKHYMVNSQTFFPSLPKRYYC